MGSRVSRIAMAFVGLFALTPCFTPAVIAEPLVALVVGNSAYKVSPLPNPASDARLMAKTLRGLGFEVMAHQDLDQKQLKRAIKDFGDRLEGAGPEAVGLFFYAGHGVQVDGSNFLIPVNNNIRDEGDVDIEAVNADVVLKTMAFARNRLNFVILDACRDNPYSRSFRSATRGLARMDAPRGTLVAYSTAPGAVAEDGQGANSTYTRALVAAMRAPGLSAEHVFKRVRVAVMSATGERQVPWEESSLTGDFYFSPEASANAASAPSAPPQEPELAAVPSKRGLVPQPGSGVDDTALEVAFWRSIKDSRHPEEYEAYLEAFPDGAFAPLARRRAERSATRQETVAAAAVPEPAFEVEPLQYWYVTIRNANVREQPILESARITTLAQGTLIFATGKVKGRNWLRVALSGTTGFVHAALLGVPPPPPAPAATPPYGHQAAPPRPELPEYLGILNKLFSSSGVEKEHVMRWYKKRKKKY